MRSGVGRNRSLSKSDPAPRGDAHLGTIILHRKDLAIALDLETQTGSELPVASLAASFEDELIAQGYGDDDISALARSIRQRSSL